MNRPRAALRGRASADERRYIVCYDIPSEKRRRRLARALQGWGQRVQYSVFEAQLAPTVFDKFLADIRAVIDAQHDSVLIYSLCATCRGRTVAIGKVAAERKLFDLVMVF